MTSHDWLCIFDKYHPKNTTLLVSLLTLGNPVPIIQLSVFPYNNKTPNASTNCSNNLALLSIQAPISRLSSHQRTLKEHGWPCLN